MISFFFTFSCSSKKQLASTSDSNNPALTSDSPKPEPQTFPFFVFNNGSYVEVELDKKPEIIGGPTALYRDIRYPAFAREHGIQGTVRITVTVNEFGQVEDAVINSHVGGGCDEEGLRVVNMIKGNGFDPALLGGIPVKVKFDLPIRFILQ